MDRTDTSKSKIKREFSIMLEKKYIDHFVDGEYVYLLMSGSTKDNVIWVFTNGTFETASTFEAPESSKLLYVEGDTLYIGTFDTIYEYDKNTYEQKKKHTINVMTNNMLVYNGIIYISAVRTGGQHIIAIPPEGPGFSARVDNTEGMCVNKDEGILYVAGKSKLYAFKLDNLELIKEIDLPHNQEKKMVFYDSGKVYTAGCVYDSSNLDNFIALIEINPAKEKETYYADSNYVITEEGVFDSQTLDIIMPLERKLHRCFITSSGNVFIIPSQSGTIIDIQNINDYLDDIKSKTFYTIVEKDASLAWNGKPKITSYLLNDEVIDMAGTDKICYLATSNQNKLIAFKVDTMEVVFSFLLPGVPGRLVIYDSEAMISFPDLKVIKCYDRTTGKYLRDIPLENQVYSFAVHGSFLYYTIKGSSYIYKHNLGDNTSISKSVSSDLDFVINAEDEVIYAANDRNLYVLDMHELNIFSIFSSDSYAGKSTRTVFYIDYKIYALGHAFDKNDTTKPIMNYSTSKSDMKVLFADNEYVVCIDGIYSRKSDERLITIDLNLLNAWIEKGYFVGFVKGYTKSGSKLYVGSMSSMVNG